MPRVFYVLLSFFRKVRYFDIFCLVKKLQLINRFRAEILTFYIHHTSYCNRPPRFLGVTSKRSMVFERSVVMLMPNLADQHSGNSCVIRATLTFVKGICCHELAERRSFAVWTVHEEGMRQVL